VTRDKPRAPRKLRRKAQVNTLSHDYSMKDIWYVFKDLADLAENPQPAPEETAGPSWRRKRWLGPGGEMKTDLIENPLLARNNIEWLASTWDDLYNYTHVSLDLSFGPCFVCSSLILPRIAPLNRLWPSSQKRNPKHSRKLVMACRKARRWSSTSRKKSPKMSSSRSEWKT
jgi:hypothetical protein